jgi:Ca2+-binding RTX toxin-like protein
MGYKSFGTALLTTSALLGAASAQAAPVSYPDGGSSFATDAQGWTGTDTSCTGTGAGLLCTASNDYDPGVGNPPGSIATRVNVTANAGGLFSGTGTFVSPSFTATAGQQVNGATFQYDRRFETGDLANLTPTSNVAVRLVDETANSTTTLLTEDVGSSTSFVTRGVGVPAGAVVAGHSYRLRLETMTSSTTAALGVMGGSSTHFDNVVLTADQGSSAGGGGRGGDTPIVSPGVTIVRGPLSETEINVLFRRFDETTDVGRGPGGSLVPLAACTIVGTPGKDRVIGTRGNDVICGLGGNDVLNGAGGIDIIDGARGADRLSGAGAKDKLIGLAGNDRESGGGGKDQLGGGAGKDRLKGGKGGDRMHGGSGTDRLSARDRTRDRVDGGKGRDRAQVDRARRTGRRVKGLRTVDRVRRVERRR